MEGSEMDNKSAKFEVVANQIHQRILDGVYVPEQKLPSEYDFAEEFDVSRLTIRKAIERLITQQVVIKKKGKGTYIIKPQKIQSGGTGLRSFSEVASQMGKTSKTELIKRKKVKKLPEAAAEIFNQSDTIISIKRLRYMDDEPMTIEEIYTPERLIKGASDSDLIGSLFELLERKTSIAYSHQEIEAIAATAEVAKVFGISEGSPVFKVYSATYSIDAKPVLYDISYYRADKYSFKHTLIRQS